jgi:hypothetical protein
MKPGLLISAVEKKRFCITFTTLLSTNLRSEASYLRELGATALAKEWIAQLYLSPRVTNVVGFSSVKGFFPDRFQGETERPGLRRLC